MDQEPVTKYDLMSLIFYGPKLDASYFKIVGCIAYAFVPKELKKKIDPIIIKCIFVKYN